MRYNLSVLSAFGHRVHSIKSTSDRLMIVVMSVLLDYVVGSNITMSDLTFSELFQTTILPWKTGRRILQSMETWEM